jgi:methionyl-tRNA synthetase
MSRGKFYLTTPIYYVNGEPHIGHVYSTVIADYVTRLRQMEGHRSFLLSGTDEHAAKVVASAGERGLAPEEWAERNARVFRDTFARYAVQMDDFIRTSEPRHKAFAQRLIEALVASQDVYLGEYEGWYDAGQEEYVPENRAAEHHYKSPVSGSPLVRRREQNYFFRLSAYEDRLLELLEERPEFVRPEARRNEAIGRIREGLTDVPISRTGTGDWGVRFPGTEDHLVYVWVEALISYVTPLDREDRRSLWPADVHLIGKEILWFHAVIWPALLLALEKTAKFDWIGLPSMVYSHSFFLQGELKMSKSLGNVIGLDTLDRFVDTFGLDALRYFLITQGPDGTMDATFSEPRFIDVYNADLANTLGNCWNRIANMTGRYLGGRLPQVDAGGELRGQVEAVLAAGGDRGHPLGLDEVARSLEIVRRVDAHIEATQPFRLAKDPAKQERVAGILYACAEAYRIASLRLWPAMPGKVEEIWRRLRLPYASRLRDRGPGELGAWSAWGGIPAGTELLGGEPLFPRYIEESEGR